jgi:hypothetical protein
MYLDFLLIDDILGLKLLNFIQPGSNLKVFNSNQKFLIWIVYSALIVVVNYSKYPIEWDDIENNFLIWLILQIFPLNLYLHLIFCNRLILRKINYHLIALGNLYFLY